ncbi:hypothetical protein [Moorena producens]|uniref:hypothetical protein n=1 Tax=Moorena producens TaxID=1155739 RepID=UPI0011EA6FF5|nr:hypothetical protein [Moorena producens]
MHLQQDISQWVALRDGFRGLRGGKSEAFRPGHTLLTFLFSIPDSRFPIPDSLFPIAWVQRYSYHFRKQWTI